jgi:Na+/proline symporter
LNAACVKGAITKRERNYLMETGSTNARLYCLTIAFVGALLAFTFGSGPNTRGDRYDLLLFFAWATFIPWFVALVLLPIKTRIPKL